MINYRLETTRQEAGLTRTSVWQAGTSGTRRLNVLNAGTFMYRMNSGRTVLGRYLNFLQIRN